MFDTVSVLRSLWLFIVAGVCEIGGGWLIWKWLRDDRPTWWGLLGGVVLILYGIIPTLQMSHFGRVYAVYGGLFIVLSLLWGWYFDGNRPDRADVIGGAIALVGVCVMMYWPRPPVKHGEHLLARFERGVAPLHCFPNLREAKANPADSCQQNQFVHYRYPLAPVNKVFSSTKLIGLPNGSFAQNMRSPHGIFWMPPSTIVPPASIACW
jgi:small multidrug resistance family-3 protein